MYYFESLYYCESFFAASTSPFTKSELCPEGPLRRTVTLCLNAPERFAGSNLTTTEAVSPGATSASEYVAVVHPHRPTAPRTTNGSPPVFLKTNLWVAAPSASFILPKSYTVPPIHEISDSP